MTLGKDVREKQGEEREQKVLPAEKTTAVSYSDAPAPTAAAATLRDVGISLPGGPFPLAAAPGTAAGRVGRPSLLEAAAAQMLLVQVEGRDKQNLNGLLGQGSEWNQLLLAGGGGQGGHLGDSQNKATAPMKWMTVEMVSFHSATDQGITETVQHSKS